MTVAIDKTAVFVTAETGAADRWSRVEATPSIAAEAVLVAQWKAGSSEAFGEIVRLLHGRVFNFLAQATRHRADAEDLCQETFLAAHRSIHRHAVGRSVAPWLFGIARHLLATHWRRSSRLAPLPENLAEYPDQAADPAGLAATDDDQKAVWRVARRLKPQQFQALWLRYVEGLSVAELATSLGVTVIHAKVILFRARNELARRLTTLDRGPESKGERPC